MRNEFGGKGGERKEGGGGRCRGGGMGGEKLRGMGEWEGKRGEEVWNGCEKRGREREVREGRGEYRVAGEKT